MLRTMPSALRGTRVLVRVDLNVPIVGRRATDTYDLERVLPTIRRLHRRGNVIVLLAHHSNERQSLRPLRPLLAKGIGAPVAFIRDPRRLEAGSAVQQAAPGAVFLVENLRFFRGEKANSPVFARSLSVLGEVFINDAFGELHRPYASIAGIPRYLPAFAGPLVMQEVAMLRPFRRRSKPPLVVVFGGAKVATKLSLLRRFMRLADQVLVGGAMANTLLVARGVAVGRSYAQRVPAVAGVARSRRVTLPADVLVARPSGRLRVAAVAGIAPEETICDIGPATRRMFAQAIAGSGTVIWNGPLGFVEDARCRGGTAAVARAVARLGSNAVVGGGDTVAFLAHERLLKRFRRVSTGGGAMLAYLAGERLPGLEALRYSRR